jgi:hypothetical protein
MVICIPNIIIFHFFLFFCIVDILGLKSEWIYFRGDFIYDRWYCFWVVVMVYDKIIQI